MHHRCVYKICCCYHYLKQGCSNSGYSSFPAVVLQIRYSSPNPHWRWERICQQAHGQTVWTSKCPTFQDDTISPTAQVEVFNKTVKKYLASYLDETKLNWDEFLPALMLVYNTSYHSTIATMPFELLFEVKPKLPSLPAPEIQCQHYGESSCRTVAIVATCQTTSSTNSWGSRLKIQTQFWPICCSA